MIFYHKKSKIAISKKMEEVKLEYFYDRNQWDIEEWLEKYLCNEHAQNNDNIVGYIEDTRYQEWIETTGVLRLVQATVNLLPDIAPSNLFGKVYLFVNKTSKFIKIESSVATNVQGNKNAISISKIINKMATK